MNAGIRKLKTLWQNAGHATRPSPGGGELSAAPAANSTARKARTARLDLRITPEEKQRTELLALREGIAINELVARMLAHYERDHGRVEIKSTTTGTHDC